VTQGGLEADQPAETLLDTIEKLTRSNRRQRSTEIEVQLAGLRREAFADVEGNREAVPKRAFADPFPNETGLVEVPASDLDVEILGGAIAHHGCILVRKLLTERTCDTMCRIIDQSFSAAEASRNGAPPEATAPWYVPLPPHPRYPARFRTMRGAATTNRILMVDCPRGLFEITEGLKEAGWDVLAQDYLGGRLLMTENKWSLYRIPPRRAYNPMWHQEASVFPKRPIRALNAWTAFSSCGRDAPGLRVIPERVNRVIAPARGYVLDPAAVAAAIGNAVPVAPDFGPGDALVFDEMALHSPYYAEGMTENRYAMEAWFFAPGGHPTELGALVF
jgi:hypothetical protein